MGGYSCFSVNERVYSFHICVNLTHEEYIPVDRRVSILWLQLVGVFAPLTGKFTLVALESWNQRNDFVIDPCTELEAHARARFILAPTRRERSKSPSTSVFQDSCHALAAASWRVWGS